MKTRLHRRVFYCRAQADASQAFIGTCFKGFVSSNHQLTFAQRDADLVEPFFYVRSVLDKHAAKLE
ncbi:hypothetical protein [Cupriavidus pauculus]|uniref:hypothetical protein n=1 Tax=Cupriavidus pauculus TaxID=82633 RepID=UPI000ABD3D7A|nr:hypothetical protein [Cupriavidus pauculus]MBY4733032.1 hypothetical protein [Cupriavidus pauculus]